MSMCRVVRCGESLDAGSFQFGGVGWKIDNPKPVPFLEHHNHVAPSYAGMGIGVDILFSSSALLTKTLAPTQSSAGQKV